MLLGEIRFIKHKLQRLLLVEFFQKDKAKISRNALCETYTTYTAIEVIEMENNISPWQERFTWFWFCEDEILRYTEDDFKRRAKELHDRGITVAINFSLTHFRMSYYKYWDVINASFRKFVDACHEYGIKVIEHHSSSWFITY